MNAFKDPESEKDKKCKKKFYDRHIQSNKQRRILKNFNSSFLLIYILEFNV